MFEILMFLFENYMNGSVVLKMDNETLLLELEKIGFNHYDITEALHWLDGLIQFQGSLVAHAKLTPHAIRHYLPEEIELINVEGRGLLLYLEQIGILDPVTREIVIDRLMALDRHEIDLKRIKWVVLIVLFNQPEKKAALNLMQEMVLVDTPEVIH